MMFRSWRKYCVWLLVLVLFLPPEMRGQVPDRPEPPRLVNDLAGLLTWSQAQELEDSLVTFDRETSTQITVVTLLDLKGYDKADMAFRIGEEWGVGRSGKNNGIVILVKPKTPVEKGEVYISVGYGLEGVIPDAIANRVIVNREMIPRFRDDDYFGGIMAGSRAVMGLARGEFTADTFSGDGSQEVGGVVAFILLIVFIILLGLIVRGGSRKSFHAGSRDIPFWIWLAAMNQGKQGGSWSDFSGGRGGFGGMPGSGGFKGGGGGFGGFGGGRFGGGGAGGSW